MTAFLGAVRGHERSTLQNYTYRTFRHVSVMDACLDASAGRSAEQERARRPGRQRVSGAGRGPPFGPSDDAGQDACGSIRTHARVGRAQIRPCGWSTTVRPETPRALVADRTPERHPALRAPEDPHTVFRRRARTVAAHLPGTHDGHPAERRAREIYQTSTTSTDRTAPTALVDHALSSDNLMYAIRIKGTFGEVRTRTVMRQPPPCLHGASLPLLPARAPVVLRRPADSGGWPFPVRWPPPWCGPGPTFCPSPATAASSSAHRSWRPRPASARA